MKIKLLVKMTSDAGLHCPGDTIEVSPDRAASMIAAKLAVEVDANGQEVPRPKDEAK